MKPTLLVLIPLRDDARAAIAAQFDLIHAPDEASRAQAVAEHGAKVEAVLTNGSTGLTEDELARLPGLVFLNALGAGYENLPVAAARRRGIAIAHGVGANDDCVADHAFALLLATVRGVVRLDAACRAGVWRDALPMQPNFSGKRIGIVGLGRIGAKIARRAAAFDLEIGYHNRRPREGAEFRYFPAVVELARWADYLVVATPGGADTRHLIDAAVLAALGARGFLVNVSRGSVVDTAALAAALRDGRIAGAGLDVYEGEPEPPAELVGLDSVVLTPHVAGTSPEARDRTIELFLENAARHFAGQPLLTPLQA
ncbi:MULTISPECIES: 2-hydroxyacid dehydrogenase [Burkholderia]|jgi:lactate dehydrogenase-like 2-hydroxyacid dehydrogenase|uniref:D-isomer specific 2-hydroxyacid dehydrogenase, NAD binding domain protein n=1 Tax=Burkholderia gladioli TaxID=28095 RepID=A0AAW3F4R4_BURGA|nr:MULTISPECIES: 2-hydroxyacid dehydrogenase [Burkholderia]AJW93968.1 D-isomer specific 2-hydroxyacid dehydrogenase, NAD binding domain protein [Burkholderia gladioli]ASD82815.1 2-hydroxyacid dehydrogenase [Burkholderia gladioli pv. gladioli]AWY50251.1 2-hydroxyacid dehydrogenase [Burkholderia gladioli pv. gladioli]KAF1059695.1 2-ketogluconate reductase [Burkholderia gladioli]KGC15551.1 D-isomer specific 2-hydroxyacid dehydrogenase, NAD binding domain protein [Burkholderia gladioli]